MRWAVSFGIICTPLSAIAAPVLGGETELHVEARGSVLADYAVISNEIAIFERGKPACEATLRQREAAITAKLLEAGIPRDAVTIGKNPCVQQESEGAPQNAFGFAEAVLNPGIGSAPDPAQQNESTVEPAEVRSPEADNARNESLAADSAARAARKEAEHKRRLPYFISKMPISVRVDDLAKVPKVLSVYGAGVPMMIPLGKPTSEFHFNKPADVQTLAYADALSKARKEADILAHSLGAHVVRIARVSNREAPVSLSDVIVLIGMMAQTRGGDIPWTIPATHSVSIAVDYVISPN